MGRDQSSHAAPRCQVDGPSTISPNALDIPQRPAHSCCPESACSALTTTMFLRPGSQPTPRLVCRSVLLSRDRRCRAVQFWQVACVAVIRPVAHSRSPGGALQPIRRSPTGRRANATIVRRASAIGATGLRRRSNRLHHVRRQVVGCWGGATFARCGREAHAGGHDSSRTTSAEVDENAEGPGLWSKAWEPRLPVPSTTGFRSTPAEPVRMGRVRPGATWRGGPAAQSSKNSSPSNAKQRLLLLLLLGCVSVVEQVPASERPPAPRRVWSVVRRCLVGWRRGRGIRLAVLLRVMLLRVRPSVGLMLWRRFGGRTLLGFLRLVVVVRRLWWVVGRGLVRLLLLRLRLLLLLLLGLRLWSSRFCVWAPAGVFACVWSGWFVGVWGGGVAGDSVGGAASGDAPSGGAPSGGVDAVAEVRRANIARVLEAGGGRPSAVCGWPGLVRLLLLRLRLCLVRSGRRFWWGGGVAGDSVGGAASGDAPSGCSFGWCSFRWGWCCGGGSAGEHCSGLRLVVVVRRLWWVVGRGLLVVAPSPAPAASSGAASVVEQVPASERPPASSPVFIRVVRRCLVGRRRAGRPTCWQGPGSGAGRP